MLLHAAIRRAQGCCPACLAMGHETAQARCASSVSTAALSFASTARPPSSMRPCATCRTRTGILAPTKPSILSACCVLPPPALVKSRVSGGAAGGMRARMCLGERVWRRRPGGRTSDCATEARSNKGFEKKAGWRNKLKLGEVQSSGGLTASWARVRSKNARWAGLEGGLVAQAGLVQTVCPVDLDPWRPWPLDGRDGRAEGHKGKATTPRLIKLVRGTASPLLRQNPGLGKWDVVTAGVRTVPLVRGRMVVGRTGARRATLEDRRASTGGG